MLLGLIYFRMNNSQISVNDRIFLLFYASLLQGVRMTFEAVRFFIEEKQIVIPEYENGMCGLHFIEDNYNTAMQGITT